MEEVTCKGVLWNEQGTSGVSVVSALFMALLVTAAGFRSLKFPRECFPRRMESLPDRSFPIDRGGTGGTSGERLHCATYRRKQPPCTLSVPWYALRTLCSVASAPGPRGVPNFRIPGDQGVSWYIFDILFGKE